MSKPKIYVESSTISYLTARPTEEPLRKAKQIYTRMWWEKRERYDLYISQTVLDEISEGNTDAAKVRLEAVDGLTILPPVQDIKRLTEVLLDTGTVPKKVENDATHIAYAAAYGMDFLITWNQKHIATDYKMKQIEALITGFGYKPPLLTTPERYVIYEEAKEIKND
ncbi:MAG: type II toxin-antitoxin system VapC family toxin [Thermoguttaceae bacterium]